MVTDVYQQYFKAEAVFHEVERHGASVVLTSDSEAGNIRYEAAVTFFPHNDDEDFGISYDAYFSKELYNAKGRRSKKREKAFLEDLQNTIDELIKEEGAKIFWDEPLREARIG